MLDGCLTVCDGRRLNVAKKANACFTVLSVKLFLDELRNEGTLDRNGLARGTTRKVLVSLINFAVFMTVGRPVTCCLSTTLVKLKGNRLCPTFLGVFVGITHRSRHNATGDDVLAN